MEDNPVVPFSILEEKLLAVVSAHNFLAGA